MIFSVIVYHIVVLSFHPGCDNSYLTGTLKLRLHTTINQDDFRFCRMLMTNVVSCIEIINNTRGGTEVKIWERG